MSSCGIGLDPTTAERWNTDAVPVTPAPTSEIPNLGGANERTLGPTVTVGTVTVHSERE